MATNYYGSYRANNAPNNNGIYCGGEVWGDGCFYSDDYRWLPESNIFTVWQGGSKPHLWKNSNTASLNFIYGSGKWSGYFTCNGYYYYFTQNWQPEFKKEGDIVKFKLADGTFETVINSYSGLTQAWKNFVDSHLFTIPSTSLSILDKRRFPIYQESYYKTRKFYDPNSRKLKWA